MGKVSHPNAFTEFFKTEQFGGTLLLICVVISLTIANTSYAVDFASFIAFVPLHLGGTIINFPVASFINDGLMAVFFLLVGLEIKRELVAGELSSIKKASLPVVAAMGGMIVPALIYFLFNKNTATTGGWGIPMATDIAFALAIIAMLGKNVPSSLKIFLAALAIVDDLGAILVIAVFYTDQVHFDYMLMAAGVLLLLVTLNYFNVKSIIFYLIPGIFLWYFIHHSGIHATIAGVLLALTIPKKIISRKNTPVNSCKQNIPTNNEGVSSPSETVVVTHGNSPLEKLEHLLHKPVNFFIMPVFALANTNITFQKEILHGLISPLGGGIVIGLFAGKTIGVTLFSWLAVKLKLGQLPSRSGWKHIIGLGMLAGIGFTMSIFISMLSFSDEIQITEAKFAILCASAISGVLGFIYLRFVKVGKSATIRK